MPTCADVGGGEGEEGAGGRSAVGAPGGVAMIKSDTVPLLYSSFRNY